MRGRRRAGDTWEGERDGEGWSERSWQIAGREVHLVDGASRSWAERCGRYGHASAPRDVFDAHTPSTTCTIPVARSPWGCGHTGEGASFMEVHWQTAGALYRSLQLRKRTIFVEARPHVGRARRDVHPHRASFGDH